MKALRDGILAIIGAVIFAICVIIILTADYNPIRVQLYALFAVVARVLRIGATG
jgi:urea transporter